MQIIGIRATASGESWVASLDGDKVHPIATVSDFWIDPHGLLVTESFGPPLARSQVTEISLVPPSARVICVGLNYRAHAAEGSFAVPDHPTLFGRWTASLSVDGVPAPVPANEPGLDWEGEVAAYIGARLEDVDESTAHAGIFGYSTFNDLTARTAQKLTTQWTLGKNGDFSGPAGPLVTADETGDPADGWRITSRVNGTTVQDGNTSAMIFSPAAVVSLVSKTLTLHPGDVIATGTPEGVGYVRNPPWLLQPGDVVEVEVDHLGVLTTPIVGAQGRKDA